MSQLLLASLFFPLSHILIASTRLRAALVNRLGERRYSLGYSLLAALALVWLVVAYHHAPVIPLWNLPHWVRLALAPIILGSAILTVAGLTTANPVIVRSEALFDRPEIVQGILRITRNPFFWGVGLIAIAHMIIIGDVAALLAFGSAAFLGLAGAPLLDAKKARRHGRAWQAFAAVTSDIPFLAIMQGRQRFAWREIGSWRIGLGLAVFLIALALHPTLLGAYGGVQMRDLLVQAAGSLGIAAALVHGYLGETRVFATARIEPDWARRLLRLVWHGGVVAWVVMGVLLILVPTIRSDEARIAIIAASAAVFGAGVIGNAWASRGRHFGWVWLSVVVGFALAGM
jgi:uncharacterized membrane protein